MKANNRKEFEAAWKEHFAQCRPLCESLPQGQVALDFLELCKKLDEYIKIAAENTYGNKDYAKVLAKLAANNGSVSEAVENTYKVLSVQALALGDPKKSLQFFKVVANGIRSRVANIESLLEADQKAAASSYSQRAEQERKDAQRFAKKADEARTKGNDAGVRCFESLSSNAWRASGELDDLARLKGEK